MTRAIILAAGQGSRLGKITAATPKCMVQLAGKPLLHHQISALERAGITDIVVVCGFEAERVDALGHAKRLSLRFAETNMVHTLFIAEDLLGDDVIVGYGDIVYDDKVLQTLLSASGDIQVVVDLGWLDYWRQRCANPLDDAETLSMDVAKARLLSLGRKPKTVEEVQGQYIGLTRYRGEGVRHLRNAYHAAHRTNAWGSGRTLEKAYMTDLIDYLCSVQHVTPVLIQRGWVEIDTESDLKLAEDEARAFLSPESQ